jgi:hypothetical protein
MEVEVEVKVEVGVGVEVGVPLPKGSSPARPIESSFIACSTLVLLKKSYVRKSVMLLRELAWQSLRQTPET